MRRVVVSAVGLVVVAAVPALAVPGQNESRGSTPVRQSVRSVVVDLHSGSVVLRRGNVGAVDVVKRWSEQEPTFTVKVSDRGVLTVTGRCPSLVDTPVVSVGSTVVGECSTSVVVTLPAAVLDTTVDTYGNVTLSDFQGTHKLGTGSGSLTVSRTAGNLLQLDTSSGTVSVRDIRTATLKADSGSGNVTLERAVVTGAVSLDTNGGRVRATDVQAASLKSSSGSGDVTLTRARLRGAADLDTNGGDVKATDVVAQSLSADSGSGLVSAVDVTVRTPLTLSTNGGAVTVRHAKAPKLDLSSGSGDVTIVDTATGSLKARTNGGDVTAERTPATTFDLSTGSGDIKVVTGKAPSAITADTNGGDVLVTVPRGAYGLKLSQNGGELIIDGITPDSRSGRVLDLSTGSGDITVLGR